MKAKALIMAAVVTGSTAISAFTATAAHAADCNWNPTNRSGVFGEARGTGIWNLYKGPGTNCAKSGKTIEGGWSVRLHCYAYSSSGVKWYYLDDHNAHYGWVSHSNISGSPTLAC